MRTRIHVFSGSAALARSIEHYLRSRGARHVVEWFLFSDIDAAALKFDAAVADAFELSGSELRTSGVDLYERFPGRVVLVTPLWAESLPERWPLFVPLPIGSPERLAMEVDAALAGTHVAEPLNQLRQYLLYSPEPRHRERVVS